MKTKTQHCKPCGKLRLWQFFNGRWSCWYCGEIEKRPVEVVTIGKKIEVRQERLL